MGFMGGAVSGLCGINRRTHRTWFNDPFGPGLFVAGDMGTVLHNRTFSGRTVANRAVRKGVFILQGARPSIHWPRLSQKTIIAERQRMTRRSPLNRKNLFQKCFVGLSQTITMDYNLSWCAHCKAASQA